MEITIHSTPINLRNEPHGRERSTVRNYQFGFTFAPFGDPENVCHFLAWDFPHINNAHFINMDYQYYSFSDLIKLIKIINDDIYWYCREKGITDDIPGISGICNHWAGNSIYHQHYQFFIISNIPALSCENEITIINYKNVVVNRLKWPIPVYEITSLEGESDQGETTIMFVAERIAGIWKELNEGHDKSYGNGILIENHTQNIFVSRSGKKIRAIFVPRLRSKLDATANISGKQIKKGNMAVLEMLGYFVIDDKDHFNAIEKANTKERDKFGETLLLQMKPDDNVINEFEEKIRWLDYEIEIAINNANNLPSEKAKKDALLNVMYKLKNRFTDFNKCQRLLKRINSDLREISRDDAFEENVLEKMAKFFTSNR